MTKAVDMAVKIQTSTVEDFFLEIDVCGGPTMSYKTLQGFVLQAPEEVQKTSDYCYLIGLLFARSMYEVVGDFSLADKVGPNMPFEELERYIQLNGDPDPDEPRALKTMRGFYDGRLIHEQLGGINNEDDDALVPGN